MAEKAVTHLDLSNLKNQITEEQMKIRHDQRNEIWQKLFIVDELKTEQQLTNQSMKSMQEDIKEIKAMIKEWFASLPNTYATKEDHKANKEKLEQLEKEQKEIKDQVLKATIWLVISGIIAIIWVILKKIWIL